MKEFLAKEIDGYFRQLSSGSRLMYERFTAFIQCAYYTDNLTDDEFHFLSQAALAAYYD